MALEVVRFLRRRNEEITGVAVHPQNTRSLGDEIVAAAEVPPGGVIDGSRLNDPEIMNDIMRMESDVGLSVMFGFILRPTFLSVFPKGCLNLHTSLLPFNRGAHPNVWSIVDGTPAGVTLHLMDEGIDTGPILAQEVVEVESIDTARSLYERLEERSLTLFKRAWSQFTGGELVPVEQDLSIGSTHRVRDLERLDLIDLDRPYTARSLINVIRARTFPPYASAYFLDDDGRKVYLRIQLEYEQEEEP